MAFYLVTAKPKTDRLGDLRENLRKNIYEPMRPFGPTLNQSLRNARIREDGYAVWEEEDYCTPPLAQEREAAIDEFFDELRVQSVSENAGWNQIDSLPRLFPELEHSS